MARAEANAVHRFEFRTVQRSRSRIRAGVTKSNGRRAKGRGGRLMEQRARRCVRPNRGRSAWPLQIQHDREAILPMDQRSAGEPRIGGQEGVGERGIGASRSVPVISKQKRANPGDFAALLSDLPPPSYGCAAKRGESMRCPTVCS